MRLQGAILRELLGHFFGTAGILSFAIALGGLVSATYKFSGAPLGAVATGLPLLLVGIFPHLLPVSLLVATILTYGRMSAEGEITAIRTGGVHLGRALVPALAVGFAVAALNLHLLGDTIPSLYAARGRHMRRVAVSAVEGWSRGVPDLEIGPVYLTGRAGDQPGEWRDVFLVLRGEEGSEKEVRARASAARLSIGEDELVVELEGARTFRISEKGGAFDIAAGKAAFRVSLSNLLDRRGPTVKERDQSSAELLASLRRGVAARPDRAVFEVGRRTGASLAAVAFPLLGAPLGIFFRRGNRLFAFALALAVVLLGYYPLLVLGEVLLKKSFLPPIPAAALGCAFLLLVGTALARRLFRM